MAQQMNGPRLPEDRIETRRVRSVIVDQRRLKALRETVVAELAKSMAQIGQLQPIIISYRKHTGMAPTLVAGAHRLKAAEHLKWDVIQCRIVPLNADDDFESLIEIDENLTRGGLTPVERAIHIDKREEIYARLHPECVERRVGLIAPARMNAAEFRARLKARGLTIGVFAEMTGVHPLTVANWGKRRSNRDVQEFPRWVSLLFDLLSA